MKATRSTSCGVQSITATGDLSTATDASHSLFLQIPLELRRMVYWHSIHISRIPTLEDIYQNITRKEAPSPLLCVNKQIRDEVIDILQRGPFTFRVTPHEATFDMLGLSCFLAQRRPISFNDLTELVVEIWPDLVRDYMRRYDYIGYLVKTDKKIRAGLRLRKLTIEFIDIDLAQWGDMGKSSQCDDVIIKDLVGDICWISESSRGIRMTEVSIYIPWSLKRIEFYDEMVMYTKCIEKIMEKKALTPVQKIYVLERRWLYKLYTREELDRFRC